MLLYGTTLFQCGYLFILLGSHELCMVIYLLGYLLSIFYLGLSIIIIYFLMQKLPMRYIDTSTKESDVLALLCQNYNASDSPQ